MGGWPDEWVTLNAVETAEDLHALYAWLDARQDRVLAIDCETNALDPWQPGFRTRMVQIADLNEAWAVPIWSSDGLFTCGETLGRMVHNHPRFCAHYSEADERFLCRGLGLDWDPVRWSDPEPHISDTQTVLAVYDPRTVTTHNKKDRIHPKIPRLKGLKPTTTRLLTPTLEAAETAMYARFRELAPVGYRSGGEKTRSWGFANIATDDPIYQLYGLLDPLATIRLWHLMRAELEARGQWARTEAALAEQWMVDRATYQGLRVDADYARWLDGELHRVTEDQQSLLTPHGIKPSGQGPKVGQAFNALGVTSPKVNSDGVETWDKEALAMLAEKCEGALDELDLHRPRPAQRAAIEQVAGLVLAVQTTRRADKYRGTWVRPMLWTVDNADGAMHPSMRAVGTVTTRMSCQKSNTAGPLHSAPKREETRLRACVRAERGHVFVSADLKQGEPFTMAALSGDPDYLRDLQAGDINSTLATQVYGDVFDPSEGKTAGTASYTMRQACKFAWLAACYGAQEPKVDALLGVHTGALGRWRASYPVFWAYSDSLNWQTAIQLDSGHRVPLWDRYWVDDNGELQIRQRDGRPLPSRLGLNAATQGTQSDILRVAMHRLRIWGWGWALRFFLHDEILGCVPAWMAEQFRDVLEEAMTVTYRGVVIRCDATIDGVTWMPQTGSFDRAALASVDDTDD